MRPLRWLARFVVALVLVGVGTWCAIALPQRPSATRTWARDQERLARAELFEDSVRIRDVRDFRYSAETTYTPGYYDRTYHLDSLTSVWFVVTPFNTAFRGPAHTFVSFGFGDSTFVSISVEAHREVGERYGFVSGALRQFEIVYVVGDERDLIARRALYDGGETYLYPIRATPDARRRMFVEMLERSNALQDRAEFYNTLTSNCTSNVVDHVNRIAPGKVAKGIRTILPGYTDEVAHELGLIDGEGTLAELRTRFRINERARRAGMGPDFSRLIRGD
jgi:Domain of unknown function (DUF4105)